MSTNEELPPIAPDIAEQELGELIDNIVPTRGYEMLPMVGIGGSAGSIGALQSFFQATPPDLGVSFVVIMHLSPEHESNLAAILQHSTTMPVRQVTTTEKVEPNHVYVIPPRKVLTSLDGFLRLTDMSIARGRRVAVDLFFRTLADTHGPHAVAIVLSGSDGDGAIGIKRIKERGGLTIAQDPQEAEHDGMPRAAIGTGMVDWVLRAGEIPAKLAQYQAQERRLRLPSEDGPQPAQSSKSIPEDEVAMRDVLTFLRTQTGRDFSYYKRATILRRIGRRMQVNGIDDLPSYLTFMRTHPGEAGALLQDFFISVTNFFRDRTAFEVLERNIPKLFEGKHSGDFVRVWVAACATGEEAYSIAMLLAEYARTIDSPPAIQVFATDLDEAAIQKARDGIYPEAIVADVSDERLRRFFIRVHQGYRVRRELRETVLFAAHDLLKDSPFSNLDLVTCRNLLIYLDREAQQRAIDLFHFALVPGGRLFLGTSEQVNEESPQFTPIDKKFRLYVSTPSPRMSYPVPLGFRLQQRAQQARDWSLERPALPPPSRFVHPDLPELGGKRARERRPADTWADLHYRMLERVAPPSVLVNGEHEVLHLSEHAGRYLRLAGGTATLDLLRSVDPSLRLELRAVLSRASQNATPESTHDVAIELDGEPKLLKIRVVPLPEVEPDLLLVIFDERPNADSLTPVAAASADALTWQLEHELEQMKAHVRELTEQAELTHEELRAGNEELQAMNEELRSATEELETGREELQSINEELTTVNQELKSKVDDLELSNSDLHNLISATAIPIIFLDRALTISRFTPKAVELFNLIATDIGRPLSDLTHRLEYSEMHDDAVAVLEHLAPIEREVSGESSWYLARLMPYRTTDDRIAGVVLTFVDITRRKRAEEDLRRSEERLRLSIESANIFTWEVDVESGEGTVSTNVADVLGFDFRPGLKENLEYIHPDDRTSVVEAFERAAQGGSDFDIEHRIVNPKNGSPIWIRVQGHLAPAARGEPARMLGISQNISARRKMESALRDSEEGLKKSNVVLEDRVRMRMADLVRSEELLKESAAVSNRRAETLRELTMQLAGVEQRERRRLAKILHDHVQQLLVAARMRVDIVRQEPQADDVSEQLRGTLEILDESIEAARSLSVELSPPLLHENGLPTALSWLAAKFEKQNQLHVEVEADDDVNPGTEELRDMLFQATRELLLNVVKHAKTDVARVRLSRADGNLILSVEDEGVGFVTTAPRADQASFGLFYVRERVEGMGGTLSVESLPGIGTRVAISVAWPKVS